jgi:peptidoglycan hydrolase-like protein with peptidoglycan-binding domain
MLKRGIKSADVTRLQLGLAFLGYAAGAADGDFGRTTETIVSEFQKDHGLYADGIAGTATLKAYNEALTASGRDVASMLISVEAPPPTYHPTNSAPGSRLKWVRCAADKVAGRDGYDVTLLREDAAESFNRVRAAAKALGGLVSSAGGRRELEVTANANQSRTSLHYLGRAHDLSLDTGMVDLDTDSYLVERPDPAGRMWRVWCRSTILPAELPAGITGPIRCGGITIDAWYMASSTDAKGRVVKQPATKRVTFTGFDFTALMAGFGWKPVPCRPAFFSKGDRVAAEWWHFSYLTGLAPGTTFGSELLRVYSPADAAKFGAWESVKDLRFGTEWS